MINGKNVIYGYRIRAVEAAEFADEIREFDRQSNGFLLPLKPDDITQCWVAFAGDEPVGYAAMEPSRNWQRAGYLSRCAVLPEHRGHGLQRRFIKVRENSARRQGWGLLVTDTFKNDHSANNLRKCGYEIFTPPKPWAAVNAIYWRKAL